MFRTLKVAFGYPKCWSVKPGFETRFEFTFDSFSSRDLGGFLWSWCHLFVFYRCQSLQFVSLALWSGWGAVTCVADAAATGLAAIEGRHIRYNSTVDGHIAEVGILTYSCVAVTRVLTARRHFWVNWHAVFLGSWQRGKSLQRRLLKLKQNVRFLSLELQSANVWSMTLCYLIIGFWILTGTFRLHRRGGTKFFQKTYQTTRVTIQKTLIEISIEHKYLEILVQQ